MVPASRWFRLEIRHPDEQQRHPYCIESCEWNPLPQLGVGLRCQECTIHEAFAHFLRDCRSKRFEDWCIDCLAGFAEYEVYSIPDAVSFVESLAYATPEVAYDAVQNYASYWQSSCASEFGRDTGTLGLADVFEASLQFELDYLHTWIKHYVPAVYPTHSQTIEKLRAILPQVLLREDQESRCSIAAELWPAMHKSLVDGFECVIGDVLHLRSEARSRLEWSLPPIGDGDDRFCFDPPKPPVAILKSGAPDTDTVSISKREDVAGRVRILQMELANAAAAEEASHESCALVSSLGGEVEDGPIPDRKAFVWGGVRFERVPPLALRVLSYLCEERRKGAHNVSTHAIRKMAEASGSNGAKSQFFKIKRKDWERRKNNSIPLHPVNYIVLDNGDGTSRLVDPQDVRELLARTEMTTSEQQLVVL